MAVSHTYAIPAYKFLEANEQIMKRQTTPREHKTRAHFADLSFWSKLHYYQFQTPTQSLTLSSTCWVLLFRGKDDLHSHTGVFFISGFSVYPNFQLYIEICWESETIHEYFISVRPRILVLQKSILFSDVDLDIFLSFNKMKLLCDSVDLLSKALESSKMLKVGHLCSFINKCLILINYTEGKPVKSRVVIDLTGLLSGNLIFSQPTVH